MSAAKHGRVSKSSATTCAPSILKFVSPSEPSGRDVVKSVIHDLIVEVVITSEADVAKHRGDSVSSKQIASWKTDFHWLVVEG
ncbi:hypothetical protein DPMN_150690 [Dreissena polymorpha]|uniref:Uncharacterized protein n=1 Tax=Dreissena polymorpha TaxID=45954 RepID=A0A9D4FIG2_DREPO|nr:hypothetical protein DPMN_150690 [Dreissena polymorpha]